MAKQYTTAEFVPEVWAKESEREFDQNMAEFKMINRDYEGEIKEKGNTVHIFVPGTVSIKDYDESVDIDSPEVPDDDERVLTIDQQKYFNVKVGKVLEVQSNQIRLTKYMRSAMKGQRKAAGEYILNQYPYVHADNIITPSVKVDETNIHKLFAEMREKFSWVDDSDTSERRVCVSPTIITIIGLFFAGKQTAFGDKVATDGWYGTFEGWNVFESNRVPVVLEDINSDTVDETVHKILFGVPDGITFASQIPVEFMERYKPEKGFGEAVKGLTLYGAKMLAAGKRNGLLNAYFE